jgi:hypothetical protein
MKVPAFKAKYGFADDSNFRLADFANKLDSEYMIDVSSNDLMDSAVTFQDNSIGYFLQVKNPSPTVATFCSSGSCHTTTTSSSAKTAKFTTEADGRLYYSYPASGVTPIQQVRKLGEIEETMLISVSFSE